MLNKRKIRGIVKYLVWWERFTAEDDSWENVKDLENAKEAVAKFKGRLNTEVRKWEKLDMAKEKNFRRRELLRKYTVKIIESGLSFSLFSYFHFILIYLHFSIFRT